MSSPFPMFGSQDLNDDDGPVIDSLFIETDSPPDLKLAQEAIPVPDLKEPSVPTILLTGYTTLDANSTDPFLLLPPDTNRQQLKIWVRSTAATPDPFKDYVKFADRKSTLATASGDRSGLNVRIRSGSDLSLDVHTGAIWVGIDASNITALSSIEVTWVATTVIGK